MFSELAWKIKDTGKFYLTNILGLRFVRFSNLRCEKQTNKKNHL